MDPDIGMNDEDYDTINAPQFLDFSLLGIDDDDDEADKFFETHREEDDHFVPVENLSPTIHLLRESDQGNVVAESENLVPQKSAIAGEVDVALEQLPGDGDDKEFNHSGHESERPSSSNANVDIDELDGLDDSTGHRHVISFVADSNSEDSDASEEAESHEIENEENENEGLNELTGTHTTVTVTGENYQAKETTEQSESRAGILEEASTPAKSSKKISQILQPVENNVQKEEVSLELALTEEKENDKPKTSILRPEKIVCHDSITVYQVDTQWEKENMNPEQQDDYANMSHGSSFQSPQTCDEKEMKRQDEFKGTPERKNISASSAKLRLSSSLNKSQSKQEVKQIPQHLMKKAALPLPSKYTTKVTVPQPFNLHQTRTKTYVDNKQEEPEFKFKAKPMPVKALQAPSMKRKIETKVTQPMAPHFASEDRIRERHEKATVARSLSLPGSPRGASKKSGPSSIASSSRSSYQPPTPKKSLPPTPTKVQPFSFASRDEEMLKRKELKLQQELEKKVEAYKFHAQRLPSFKLKLPKKPPVEVTHVEPFKLRSDERGAMYQQAWKAKQEEEERKLKESKIFHAKSPTVLHKPAFEPVLGLHPLAEPLDIHLNTDKRAQERELYEAQMKEKEREEEERRQMEEAIRKEQERQEEIRLRKQLVHKAQPLKPFRPFQVRSSDKPLTNPQSPAFAPLPSQRRGMEKSKYPSNGSLNTPM